MLHARILFFLLICFTASKSQPNDGIKIAEARLALEKYNDCRAALDALRSVSASGKKTSVFNLYSGKTFDCLKRFDSALHYYNLYLIDNPNSSDVIQRCAELNYQKTKEKLRYDLQGTWYPTGEPGKVRYMEQRGNFIRLTDRHTEGRRDEGVIFEGRLLESGVYRGGTKYHLTNEEIARIDRMCEICSEKNNDCKAGYADSDGYFVRDSDLDRIFDDYYIETENDVLSVSSDGKMITIKKRILSEIKIISCGIKLVFRSANHEYVRLEK